MEDMVYYTKAAAYIASSLAIGVGVFSPALAQGNVAAKACETMGKYPESAGAVRGAMLISLVAIETSAIYAFVISIFILFLGGR
jgi:F-type H+-transporting ATPase subunit c